MANYPIHHKLFANVKKKKGASSTFHDVESPSSLQVLRVTALSTARVNGNQRYTESDTGRLKRDGDPDDGEKEMLAEAEDTNDRSKGRAKQKLRGM